MENETDLDAMQIVENTASKVSGGSECSILAYTFTKCKRKTALALVPKFYYKMKVKGKQISKMVFIGQIPFCQNRSIPNHTINDM